MDQRFIAELNERLFTHFVGGAWRAPLGDRQVPVAQADGQAGGQALGRIVCAGPADVARARGVMRVDAGAQPVDAAALWAALQAEAPLLEAIRRREGFAGDRLDARLPAVVAQARISDLQQDLPGDLPGDLPRGGPHVLLTAADTPLIRVAGLLIAGARRGLIWKPAPAAAASAHLLMRVLGPRASGRLAMLQGDHASGRLLAGQGGLIWAGAGSLPEGLPDPLLTLAATDPARP